MANLDRLANRTRLGFMRAQEGKEPYWPDPNSDAPDPELVAHVSRNIDSFEEKLPEWIEAFKNIPEDDFVTRTALLQQMENNFMRIGSDLEVADSDLERYQALAIALTELATTGDTSWQKMAPEQPDAMDGGADFPGFANLPKSKEESIDAIQQMFPDISREQIEESLYNSGVGYTNALLKIDIGELLNEAGIGDPPDDATDDPDYYDPAWSMAKFSDISEAGERAIQAFEEAGDDEKAAKVRDLLNDLESMDRLKDSDIGTVFNDGKLSASTKSRLAEEIRRKRRRRRLRRSPTTSWKRSSRT
jgi:hypothetical protein